MDSPLYCFSLKTAPEGNGRTRSGRFPVGPGCEWQGERVDADSGAMRVDVPVSRCPGDETILPEGVKQPLREHLRYVRDLHERDLKGGAGLVWLPEHFKTHVEGNHSVPYEHYKTCFCENVETTLADAWDDSVSTHGGRTVIVHVLVRRLIGDPGPRGATRSVPAQK